MSRRQVRVILDELENVTSKVVSRISVNVTAELIKRTPVDTGWARANWVPAIGAPSIGQAASEGPVPAQTSLQQASVAGLLGYRLRQGQVFISNNVPYITRLNAGSSDQAPAGFVQQSIVAGVKSLRGTTL